MAYGVVEVTQGNVDNGHIYLASILDLFPPSVIGGNSGADEASQLLDVHCGLDSPVKTDIARDKKIFRKRAWVSEFFKSHHIVPGDKVVIEKTGPYRYHVYPAR